MADLQKIVDTLSTLTVLEAPFKGPFMTSSYVMPRYPVEPGQKVLVIGAGKMGRPDTSVPAMSPVISISEGPDVCRAKPGWLMASWSATE